MKTNNSSYKANLLIKSQLEKKPETTKILGRSTLIKQPLSLIETQFLNLQKSNKFNAEVLIEERYKKNEKKNDINLTQNKSLTMYVTNKSLRKNCENCDENKRIEKKFFLKNYNPLNKKVQIETIYDNRVILPQNKFDSLNNLRNFLEKENVVWQKELNINLKSQRIHDTGAELLSSLLFKFRNLECLILNLSNNKLGNASLVQLGNTISGFQNLKKLEMNTYCNEIKADGINSFINSLSILKNLTELNLNFSNNMITEIGIRLFSEKLKTLKYIKKIELHFYDTNLNDICLKYLLNAFISLNSLDSIYLDIRLNNLTEKEIHSFEMSMKRKKYTKLQIIKI